MHKVKIAHEAPKSIFEAVQTLTDYDYFLVHLFEEDPEYLQLAKDAVAKGREVILDNSIFELGTAFRMDRFAYWVNEIKPTWYIVPDSLEDTAGTISNMLEWINGYKGTINPNSKMIGVVQGRNYEELRQCYRFMDKKANVDKIAFSFDLSYYNRSFPHPNKLVGWAMGRVKLLNDLLEDEIINTDKPHHLLGCSLPQEFRYYDFDQANSWIDSIDTSNPVVHGIKGIQYNAEGLRKKESIKLYTLMNEKLDGDQLYTVVYNIDMFSKFCNEECY